jgi:hypothetical protein
MQGQKTRLGQGLPHAKPGVDYPIKVHISRIRYRGEYIGSGQNADILYADAVINGKNVELRGDGDVPFQYYKLPFGDYQARLLKDPQKMAGTPLFQEYEVALPDKTVCRFTVTGISE